MTGISSPIPQHLAPQQGELIMFENSALLERLSRMRYTTVLVVFLPVITVAVYLSLTKGTAVAATAGLFLAGAVFWTFFRVFFSPFCFPFQCDHTVSAQAAVHDSWCASPVPE